MRVIGGSLKARRFKPPSGFKGRPTTDFAREALFNILDNRLEYQGLHVLDLYSGTGAMSYEFYSRGCASITAVEIDPKMCGFILKTSRDFQIENIKVIRAEARKFIKKTSIKWDVIFCDPPFANQEHQEVIEIVFEKKLLNNNGLLIVEHGPETDLSELDNFSSLRKYGHVHFSFFGYKQT